MRAALVLAAFLVSCVAPMPPKVTVDDARKNVAAVIGGHAWDITFDTPRNVVRDGILYYAVSLGGTSEGDPHGFFVSGETGDVYDVGFHLVQFASELQKSGPSEMTSGTLPAEYNGSFAIGKDPMAGELTINGQKFSLGDDGEVLGGTIAAVSATDAGVAFTVTGKLHVGQDETSKDYESSWKIELSSQDNGLTLNSIAGPGGLNETFDGKMFQKE